MRLNTARGLTQSEVVAIKDLVSPAEVLQIGVSELGVEGPVKYEVAVQSVNTTDCMWRAGRTSDQRHTI